jgi:hypothetical protein
LSRARSRGDTYSALRLKVHTRAFFPEDFVAPAAFSRSTRMILADARDARISDVFSCFWSIIAHDEYICLLSSGYQRVTNGFRRTRSIKCGLTRMQCSNEASPWDNGRCSIRQLAASTTELICLYFPTPWSSKVNVLNVAFGMASILTTTRSTLKIARNDQLETIACPEELPSSPQVREFETFGDFPEWLQLAQSELADWLRGVPNASAPPSCSA